MAISTFKRIPIEVVEIWAQLLETSDLISFRSTCKQAYVQTSKIVLQRVFSIWRSSLMGSDLEKLEEISHCEDFRNHISTILIEDDWERNITEPPMRASRNIPPINATHIWPRNSERLISSAMIGIENFRAMLADRRLCPRTVTVRDYCGGLVGPSYEPATAFTKDIFDGIDVAISSINFQELSKSVTEATVVLCPQYRGGKVAFTMLHSASLCLTSRTTLYWAEKALYHAPNLKVFGLNARGFDPLVHFNAMILARTPVAALKRLTLSSMKVPSDIIFGILANSMHTLTYISFSYFTISSGKTWLETLSCIGADFPFLTAFNLESIADNRFAKHPHAKFHGFSKDRVVKEYRPGLKVENTRDCESVTKVYYEGPGAGNLLQIVATFIGPVAN